MKYLIRMDDVNPLMDKYKFKKFLELMDKYDTKCLLAITPNPKSKELIGENPIGKDEFKELIKILKKKGHSFALHGYTHENIGKKTRFLDVRLRTSEFAGLSYEEQYKRIKLGKEILEKEYEIETDIFVAPHNTIDKTTLKVLEDLNFRVFVGGIYPTFLTNLFFKNIKIIPQIFWRPRVFSKSFELLLKPFYNPCVFVLHPQDINDFTLKNLENFLRYKKDKVIWKI